MAYHHQGLSGRRPRYGVGCSARRGSKRMPFCGSLQLMKLWTFLCGPESAIFSSPSVEGDQRQRLWLNFNADMYLGVSSAFHPRFPQLMCCASAKLRAGAIPA